MTMMMMAIVLFLSTLFGSGYGGKVPLHPSSSSSSTSTSDFRSRNRQFLPKISSFYIMGDSTASCSDGGHNPFLRPNSSVFPCSNGPSTILLPEYLAEKMGLGMIQAYQADYATTKGYEHGINFGSTYATIMPGSLGNQGLDKQRRQSSEALQLLQIRLGQKKARKVIESSVFYLSFGKDDYINFLRPGVRHKFSKEVFAHILVNRMISLVKELSNANVKKIICAGIVPLGCAPRTLWEFTDDNDPSQTLQGCRKDVNDHVQEYNALLSERLLQLNFEFPDSQIIFLDVYAAMMDIISTPRGFKFDTENPCDESTLVCWNLHNPTRDVHSLLADEAWFNKPLAISQPFSIQQLAFSG